MLNKITTYPVDYDFSEKNKYELSFIPITKDCGDVLKVVEVECNILALQKIIKSTNVIVVSVKLIQQHEKLPNKKSKPKFTLV